MLKLTKLLQSRPVATGLDLVLKPFRSIADSRLVRRELLLQSLRAGIASSNLKQGDLKAMGIEDQEERLFVD